MVVQVAKYGKLYEMLEERKTNAKIRLLNKDDVKINENKKNDYRKLTALVNKRKADMYPDENKQVRLICGLARY